MRLAVDDLTVVFKDPGGGDMPALGPLSFEIEHGTFVSLLGPSGCGKSTLIRVLAGLQAPTHGMAFLGDDQIKEPSFRIGLMFQDANLMDWRTVQDNIALPLEIAGQKITERQSKARELLEPLGLDGFAMSYPGELSGGMSQRVALGRVLIQEPQILLLDEPFGALDALTREKIGLDLLRVWAQKRQTVLMVTHDIHEAVLMSDRVLVLSQRPGQLIADFEVNLPRPRVLDVTYTNPFIQLTKQVREAIDSA